MLSFGKEVGSDTYGYFYSVKPKKPSSLIDDYDEEIKKIDVEIISKEIDELEKEVKNNKK